MSPLLQGVLVIVIDAQDLTVLSGLGKLRFLFLPLCGKGTNSNCDSLLQAGRARERGRNHHGNLRSPRLET